MRKVLFTLLSSQNLPIIIGICVGIVMGLFITPVFEDECNFRLPFDSRIFQETLSPTSDVSREKTRSPFDDYEPRINLKGKPQSAKKEPQTLIRPRYYTTELGIKQKVFVAILSNLKSVTSLGTAINSTLLGRHNVQLSFFVDISTGEKSNLKMLPIIGFNDNNQGFLALHTLKYLADKLAKTYNYFLLIRDTTYVNSRILGEMLDHISIGKDVYMGDVRKGETSGIDVCSLDAGILLSSSVLEGIADTLEKCSSQVAFDGDDEKIGRCINNVMNVSCEAAIQGQQYKTYQLQRTSDLKDLDQTLTEEQTDLSGYLTVYPVTNPAMFYFLDLKVGEATLAEIDAKIERLQESILQLAPQTPGGVASVTWPIGYAPPSVPPTRFDVMRWEFFNETHIFLDSDQSIVRRLGGVHAEDVREIVKTAVDFVSPESNSKFLRLESGYRRFDATRGMDYIVDLVFRDENQAEIRRRVELCRPISHVDTVPMPYVTEVAKVNAIVPVWDASQEEAAELLIQHFASGFMAKADNIDLRLVLLNTTQDFLNRMKETAKNLNTVHKKQGSKVVVDKFPAGRAVSAELREFAVVDFLATKLAPDTLAFLCSVHAELSADFLNRVRINTISGWQVFSPIPFADYNPQVAYPDGKKPEVFTLSTNSGFFDTTWTQFVSFYMADYIQARKFNEMELPLYNSSGDSWNTLNRPTYKDIYSLFVGQRKLHVLRAVEPLLRLHYHQRHCYDETCREGLLLSQGTRSQLARTVLEKRQHLLN